MATRPLSPHLSIWKWGPAMLTSILHRVTGDGMAFVGLPILAWWLASLAGGPEAYETFSKHASSWYGIIVLVGVSWAFFNHLASGIRHLVMDIGAGYELDTNKAGSIASIAAGVILTAAFWAALILA
jgi:succinate dehydrogenase / fumarate reductase cytochrome b subunit